MKLNIKTTAKEHPIAREYPHDGSLEASVLGAILLEEDALSEVIEMLSPADFYNKANQKIYRVIVTLFNEENKADLHIVANALKKRGELEKVGGIPYLASLTHKIASASHLRTHALLLHEYTMRRKMIALGADMSANAYDDSADVFDSLDKAEQSIFEVGEGIIKSDVEGVSPLLKKTIDEIETISKRKGGLLGISSGFHLLDHITHGWQRGEFIVVAARPGMGKTSFLLSLLRSAAAEEGKSVAIFSLEMSKRQLLRRLIAQETSIPFDKIKTGKLSEDEWQKLYKNTAKINASNIYIDDTPALSLFELKAKCRRLKARHNIDMVIVDYLQLMVAEMSKNRYLFNREQEIAAISRGLKGLAKELDIPVIAAAQLSRAVETRGGDKRPQLSDMRESGAIEQDVDIAMFLYRAEYYGIEQDASGNPAEGTAEIIIAKHRNGATGKVMLEFDAERTKFSSLKPSAEGFVQKGDRPF